MKYILESREEFDRLERQCDAVEYDYRAELEGFDIPTGAQVLDAGCGSGIVSRYLAVSNPGAYVTGCDRAVERLEMASSTASHIQNLKFKEADLCKMNFEEATFDRMVSRYVLQHLPRTEVAVAVGEMYRCLKPGGRIRLIDFDGPLYNLFPVSEILSDFLRKFEDCPAFDLQVGRKLPVLLLNAGFSGITTEIVTLHFRGAALQAEIGMMEERFKNGRPFFTAFLGSVEAAEQFIDLYLKALRAPEAVLFYNKFVVSAARPKLSIKLVGA